MVSLWQPPRLHKLLVSTTLIGHHCHQLSILPLQFKKMEYLWSLTGKHYSGKTSLQVDVTNYHAVSFLDLPWLTGAVASVWEPSWLQWNWASLPMRTPEMWQQSLGWHRDAIQNCRACCQGRESRHCLSGPLSPQISYSSLSFGVLQNISFNHCPSTYTL